MRVREVGCEAMSIRPAVLENFRMNNWKVTVENRYVGRACPTPRGEIFKDLQIDVVPVADTELEWCVLVAE